MLDVAAANHLHLDNTQHMRPQTLLPFTHLYTWAAVKKKKHTHSLSRVVTCCILCSFMASVATLTHSDLYSDDVNWDLPGSFWREELQQGGGRGGEGKGAVVKPPAQTDMGLTKMAAHRRPLWDGVGCNHILLLSSTLHAAT